MINVYALNPFRPELKGLVRDIRTTWTLEEVGLPYQRKVMDPTVREHKRPEFLALNPFGKVPTLQDDDLVLFESSAICSYLADKTGQLIPKAGSRQRVIYDQWVAFTISTLEPMAARVLGFDFFIDKDATTAKLRSDALDTVSGLLKTVDSELSKRSYLVGDTFTVADILFSSVVRMVAHTEVMQPYSHLQAYLAKNYQRPAFLRANATQA